MKAYTYRERARAAVLVPVSSPDFDEGTATIRLEEGWDGKPLEMYTLRGKSDQLIAWSEHPGPLEQYADANGAREVRHSYDLGKAGLK